MSKSTQAEFLPHSNDGRPSTHNNINTSFQGQNLLNKSARVMNKTHLPLVLGALGTGALIFYYPLLSRPRSDALHAGNVLVEASTEKLNHLQSQTREVRAQIQDIKNRQNELRNSQ